MLLPFLLIALGQIAQPGAPSDEAGPAETGFPAGRTPVLDGTLSPQEWDDASRQEIEVEPGWTVGVRYKHDGAYLYFAFEGLVRDGQERYPEVLLDLDGTPGTQWGTNSYWFHASYRDCDGDGRLDAYDTCEPQRRGWAANNFPLSGAGVVEMRISFGRVRLVTGRSRPLRLAFRLTDTRGSDSYWPRGATAEAPRTWATVTSPNRWGAPTAKSGIPRGRVDTLRVASAVLGEPIPVPVYVPPGYDPARRYPAVYVLVESAYFTHPGVQLPLAMDSALAAGLPEALVIGVPGSGAADAHHPDTPTGQVWHRFIVEELVPAVEGRYSARPDRAGRHLLGFSSGANVSVDLAARHPERFGCVAAQSPGWMDPGPSRGSLGRIFLPEALRAVAALGAESAPAFWFVWGDGDMEWEARSREHGARMVLELQGRGARVERAPDIPGDHGLHQINRSLGDALTFLLGTGCSGWIARNSILPVMRQELEGASRIVPRAEQFLQFIVREGRRQPLSLLTRTIESTASEDVLRIVQQYESDRGVDVDTTDVHARTLVPISYRAHLGNGRREAFDFGPDRVTGTIASGDSAGRSVELALEKPTFSAVVLTEVLQALPLSPGYTVHLRAYNPGRQTFTLGVRVTGSEHLRLPDGQVLDTWTVAIEGGAAPTTWWIAKQTHEAVQSRTELAGGAEFWRVRLLSSSGSRSIS